MARPPNLVLFEGLIFKSLNMNLKWPMGFALLPTPFFMATLYPTINANERLFA
jgi:hypothetical protein